MRLRFRVAPLAFAGMALTACGDSPTPTESPPPAPVVTMTILSSPGPKQGIAGYALAEPLRVQVLTDGVPTPGVLVTWSAQSGNLVPRGMLTDKYGEALADWQLGSSPGIFEAVAQMTTPVAQRVAFTATAVQEVSASVVPQTTQQIVEVGQELPLPVSVLVTHEGRPVPGVPVAWQSTGGLITPSSVTGPDGVVSARWTLGTGPGAYIASARVVGDRFGPVQLLATARNGPVTRVDVVSGDRQLIAPFQTIFQPLTLVARDRFGNAVSGVPVMWSVEQGPAVLTGSDVVTKTDGRSVARLAGMEPAAGAVVVRADLPNGLTARFTVNFEASAAVIYLDPNTLRFVSGWNRTAPAVDTVAIGATVRWQMSIFDYEDHSIEPDGAPLFVGGRFPYAGLSFVETIFTTAGTYRYIDPSSGARGTIVVR